MAYTNKIIEDYSNLTVWQALSSVCSPGLAAEEHEAKSLGKPIRYFDLEVTS